MKELPAALSIMKTLSMEGHSEMKKFLFYALALLITMTACDISEPIVAEESNAKTITVRAGQAGTKTAITEQDGQFSLTWKTGDKIAVIEGLPAVAAYNEAHYPDEYLGEPTAQYVSAPLSRDMENAVFSLNLDERENIGGQIQYVAIYPAGQQFEVAGGDWDPDKQRIRVTINFPTEQHPSADSFDPNADVLVSKVVTRSERPDELSFQFARVGTIVKMVLTGLPEGTCITGGQISLGIEAGYYMQYDPVDQKISLTDGTDGISFDYGEAPIRVGPDRSATIWLRCISGISKKIILTLYGYNNDGSLEWSRAVNLLALGRPLEFKNGGLTTFSLKMAAPDVDNPRADQIDYTNNAALDGVTLTWPHSANPNLAGYECFLLDANNVRHDFTGRGPVDGGRYAATVNGGLAPGLYSFFVRAVAVEGKESQHDFVEKNEIHVGIPLEEHISYPSSNMPSMGGNWHLSLNGSASNQEDLYHDIVYGYRNLDWMWGSPSHIVGGISPNNWAFWNKTPACGWYRITVKLLNNASTSTYAVYASDTMFEDGIPSESATPLTGTGHVYLLNNRPYFLIYGKQSCKIEEILLEYYK